MKAKPVKVVSDNGVVPYSIFVECEVDEATHIVLTYPLAFEPLQKRIIPIVVNHNMSLVDNFAWTWNGSVDRPTLDDSILTELIWGEKREYHRCHSFITDGFVKFLGDSNHKKKGFTYKLIDM